MWHLRATAVPVIIRALAMIKKGIDKHIKKIPGEPSVAEIKKLVYIDITHILWKALSM